eukprot:gb/GECG01008119.1/.p1 GENE.gb/GECG01008119.1/~~gb/GECG01008119.1/.p1  ORF type:complete len:325 (+),score=24.26 gb/GECG01008119.1/:1-975(+)
MQDIRMIGHIAEEQLEQNVKQMVSFPEIKYLTHCDDLRNSIHALERLFGEHQDPMVWRQVDRVKEGCSQKREQIDQAYSLKYKWFADTYDIGRYFIVGALLTVVISELLSEFDALSIFLPASCTHHADYSTISNPREWSFQKLHTFSLFSWISRTAERYSKQLYQNLSCIIDSTLYLGVLLLYALFCHRLPSLLNSFILLLLGLNGLPMELVEKAVWRIVVVGTLAEIVNCLCYTAFWRCFSIDKDSIGSSRQDVAQNTFAAHHRCRRLVWCGTLVLITTALSMLLSSSSQHSIVDRFIDHPLVMEYVLPAADFFWQVFELHYK